MFSTQLRCLMLMLALTAFAGLLFSGTDPVRADEPQIVELTLMFRTDAEHFESLPMPYGEDAIGIVLDGTKITNSSTVAASGEFEEPFGGLTFELTEGRYLAKGGPTSASVLATNPFLLPAHGFISLKKCVILECTASLASMAGTTYSPNPNGNIGLVFIRGFFEVQ